MLTRRPSSPGRLVCAVALRSACLAAAKQIGSRPLHVVFGGAALPHPDKVQKGGEDAFFYDDASSSFGVADGVGGSASATVDPGRFSREMLKRCADALSDNAVTDALRVASARKLSLGGSSTLLLGQLESDTGVMRFANLGDSGAMLLRPAFRRFQKSNFLWPRLVLRSQDQTHYFNCPYQASADDFGNVDARADELITTSRAGDIVIAATDGVLDNLFDHTIQVAVAKRLHELDKTSDTATVQAALDGLAEQIAAQANAIGLREDDERITTPFQEAAAREGYRFAGGKLDDVAVVCGLVRSGAPPPAAALRARNNFGGEVSDDAEQLEQSAASGSGPR